MSDNNKQCNHIIGVFNDYDSTVVITFDELKHTINNCSGIKYTLSDYCDFRRSTNLTRFIYCPYCGKKIDWSKLKKEK